MDRNERAALRWQNAQDRHRMVREMQDRELMMDPAEWSPRAAPPQSVSNGASTPHLPAPESSSPLVTREFLMEIMNGLADMVGEKTGELERTLRKSWGEGIAELSQRLDDIEHRLDALEQERAAPNWFTRMVGKDRIP